MGVIYHCSGAMIIEDFLVANEGFLATPEEIRKWRYTLIDLSAVESMDINYSDVSRVITQNASIATKAVPGVLLAVASPRDHGYGLARMWGVLVERVGWETRRSALFLTPRLGSGEGSKKNLELIWRMRPEAFGDGVLIGC